MFTNDRSSFDFWTHRINSDMATVRTLLTAKFNDFGLTFLVTDMPFGGQRDSGFGRFGGPEGLQAFSRTKLVIRDRFPLLTRAPKIFDYPQSNITVSVFKAIIRLFYSKSLTDKLAALWKMIRLFLTGTIPESDIVHKTALPGA